MNNDPFFSQKVDFEDMSDKNFQRSGTINTPQWCIDVGGKLKSTLDNNLTFVDCFSYESLSLHLKQSNISSGYRTDGAIVSAPIKVIISSIFTATVEALLMKSESIDKITIKRIAMIKGKYQDVEKHLFENCHIVSVNQKNDLLSMSFVFTKTTKLITNYNHTGVNTGTNGIEIDLAKAKVTDKK